MLIGEQLLIFPCPQRQAAQTNPFESFAMLVHSLTSQHGVMSQTTGIFNILLSETQISHIRYVSQEPAALRFSNNS